MYCPTSSWSFRTRLSSTIHSCQHRMPKTSWTKSNVLLIRSCTVLQSISSHDTLVKLEFSFVQNFTQEESRIFSLQSCCLLLLQWALLNFCWRKCDVFPFQLIVTLRISRRLHCCPFAQRKILLRPWLSLGEYVSKIMRTAGSWAIDTLWSQDFLVAGLYRYCENWSGSEVRSLPS